jgi:hypothetical protein
VFILDPGSEFFPSRIRIFSIPDPHQRNYGKFYNPKKWFLSSRKYDLGCTSRIRIPDFLPIPDPGGQKSTGSRIQGSKRDRIPDPVVKKAPDPGSGSATLMIRSYRTHMAPAGRSCWERRRCDRPPHRATSPTPRGTPPPPSHQPAAASNINLKVLSSEMDPAEIRLIR